MFEHMKNYELLLEKVSNWLKPEGKVRKRQTCWATCITLLTLHWKLMHVYDMGYYYIYSPFYVIWGELYPPCDNAWTALYWPLILILAAPPCLYLWYVALTVFTTISSSLCISSHTKTFPVITRKGGWLTCSSRAALCHQILFFFTSLRWSIHAMLYCAIVCMLYAVMYHNRIIFFVTLSMNYTAITVAGHGT